MCNLLQQVAQPQDNSITYIYGLVDPRNGYIRYVGKSNEPRSRYYNHLCPPEITARTRKANWIKSLFSQGLKPILTILESVNEREWQTHERKWIAYYKSIPGYPPLTNGTSGGDGIDKGTKFSEETKRKMSQSRMGRKISAETIAKRVAATKGRPLTEEHCKKLSEAQVNLWCTLSEEDKQKRLRNLRPKQKKERLPKVKKTHRVYPDKVRCSSRFRGVCHAKIGKPWRSFCSIGGKLKHLGCFIDEEDAARTFDRFVLANNIKDARLNFPLSDYV